MRNSLLLHLLQLSLFMLVVNQCDTVCDLAVHVAHIDLLILLILAPVESPRVGWTLLQRSQLRMHFHIKIHLPGSSAHLLLYRVPPHPGALSSVHSVIGAMKVLIKLYDGGLPRIPWGFSAWVAPHFSIISGKNVGRRGYFALIWDFRCTSSEMSLYQYIGGPDCKTVSLGTQVTFWEHHLPVWHEGKGRLTPPAAWPWVGGATTQFPYISMCTRALQQYIFHCQNVQQDAM